MPLVWFYLSTLFDLFAVEFAGSYGKKENDDFLIRHC